MNDDLPPGSSVFDRSYASAWLRRIADDLAAEVLPDVSSAHVPELQRYLEERGLRELRTLVEREAPARRGTDALRSMAHAMREYALKRPAMIVETFRHLGEESADRSPAGREFNAIALHILARQNVSGVGVASTVAQQIVPFAAILAPPERRDAVVGTVVSGLLGGILLSRTISGFVGAHLGWREMFWIGVPLALSGALLMRLMLPRSPPLEAIRYRDAIASLFQIWRDEPKLRRATLTQAALFPSFTVFWTILSLRLLEPRFGLGSDVARIFGVIGAAGMFAAPMAGRFADKRGPHLVVSLSAIGTLISWIVFGVWGSLAGLVVGVIILDVGVNAALVSNQHQIFALRPEARSRLNTIFMAGMFIGGSLGSLGATVAYHFAGWTAVSIYGGVLGTIAILLQLPLPSLRASPEEQ